MKKLLSVVFALAAALLAACGGSPLTQEQVDATAVAYANEPFCFDEQERGYPVGVTNHVSCYTDPSSGEPMLVFPDGRRMFGVGEATPIPGDDPCAEQPETCPVRQVTIVFPSPTPIPTQVPTETPEPTDMPTPEATWEPEPTWEPAAEEPTVESSSSDEHPDIVESEREKRPNGFEYEFTFTTRYVDPPAQHVVDLGGRISAPLTDDKNWHINGKGTRYNVVISDGINGFNRRIHCSESEQKCTMYGGQGQKVGEFEYQMTWLLIDVFRRKEGTSEYRDHAVFSICSSGQMCFGRE